MILFRFISNNSKTVKGVCGISFIIFFLFVKDVLYSQMPDWNTIKDKDGNTYYVDKNGKFWTSGKPEFNYKAVSLEGLDFYITHGIELIKRHYKLEGLIILKSILAMPSTNQKVYNAQIKATKEINRLIKVEGSRYKKLNIRASILLFKDKKNITLIDDRMGFKILLPLKAKIIRKRMRRRTRYVYQGILIGLNFNSEIKRKSGFNGYDALLAIDSEQFASNVNSVSRLIKNWSVNMLYENLEKNELNKSEKKIIYEFKSKHKPIYKGYDGFFIRGKYGFFIRIITSGKKFDKFRKNLNKLISGFKVTENL